MNINSHNATLKRQLAAIILMAAGWGWICGNFVQPRYLSLWHRRRHPARAPARGAAAAEYGILPHIKYAPTDGHALKRRAYGNQHSRHFLHPHFGSVYHPRCDQSRSQFGWGAFIRRLDACGSAGCWFFTLVRGPRATARRYGDDCPKT
jgi:hypothetical protein